MREEGWDSEERRKTHREEWIHVSSEETARGTWPSGTDDFWPMWTLVSTSHCSLERVDEPVGHCECGGWVHWQQAVSGV